MIVVIIAGGSGTRLWPLSTPDYPKHLLRVNGDKRSLLQHTFDRAKRLTDKIYVVSEESHIEHVKEQLEELPDEAFIVEPGRRGTANCIIAALEYISKNHDKNEVIASIHADHYIRDSEGFYHTFKVADQAATKEKRIVLIGVEPDHPATGFGYIKKGKLLSEEPYVYNVDSFKEKPDYSTAKEYFRSGNYLWNCGYFVGSLDTFTTLMKKYSPELYNNYQLLEKSTTDTYQKTYLKFKVEAIDYALIEKVPNLLVIPAAFDWMDLGSFSDLHKAVGTDQKGNHVHGFVEIEDVENSFIQNYEDKPVAVIGLDNIAVINTKDGVLVTRKDLAQQVGNVSKRINNI
jgi:mannose-1-phosphate guanylyltransferase/mannose-6-phosphate isomerase